MGMRRLDIPMIHWLTDWLFEDPSKLIALIGFFLSIFTLVRTTWDHMKEQASKFGVSWVRLDLAKAGEEKAPKISLVSPEDLGPPNLIGVFSPQSFSPPQLPLRVGWIFSEYLKPGCWCAQGSLSGESSVASASEGSPGASTG